MVIGLTLSIPYYVSTIQNYVAPPTGLRVIQSLPKPIRDEMAVFRKAMVARYPDKIIMTRPNLKNLEFIALWKIDGDKKWNQCVETVPIPLGVMLHNHVTSSGVTLPELGDGCGGGGAEGGVGDEGMGGDC